MFEETGYLAYYVIEFQRYYLTYGCSDQQFIIFLSQDLSYIGLSSAQDEVIECEWFNFSQVFEFIFNYDIVDGLSLTPIFYYFSLKGIAPLDTINLCP
ncbi:hypothetical protein KKI90_07040 [Xenorhabdus bovienii]|uniref:hypothetical protein n=1 Tax=Xenorhabdus bovienii TaxID=40576 RepID=UPI00237CB59A|nr:hypothetical protein [Xenorhabdus bovienii]MDE1486032.1 hypothetical protein [Xenorhabdus bovienii]MDE1495185.1 hypothetical protein [Xenorhabdus bovienii]MDE9473269.1 hypothetical protein [Xenorhabdus bovienii]MDE9476832.1 hypothetical protein [Xenorhabdus bovienii]MDE9529733.1 hypothetical protein [Xenorhabdus bovienii]